MVSAVGKKEIFERFERKKAEEMSDKFAPGAIVWAKCGQLYWPAEVVDFDKLDAEIKEDFSKKPEFVVKFFDEDG